MVIGLGVPVYKNFEGYTRLMASVDVPVFPFVHNNWDENRGVSVGWNEIIQRAIHARVDQLIIANDDLVFKPGSIKILADSMRRDDDLITMTNTRDLPEPGIGSADSADFACFMICPWTFVDKFGYFDEKFSPAYFEDNDMAYRITLMGGKYRQILHANMFHAGSVTQNYNGEQVVTAPMFERNKAYYHAKWGGMPGEERYDRPFNGITGKTAKDW